MTIATRESVADYVRCASSAELSSLNLQICAELRARRARQNLAAGSLLKAGDRVEWTNRGVTQRGTVRSVGPKRCRCSADGDCIHEWRVPSSMLRIVEGGAS